jgi:fucose permease
LEQLLLAWNPIPMANLLAVALIGLCIAPIFPAMMSGTSQRVGARFAANTIGMQMAATGFGGASIPTLLGVLARQVSLEIIPVSMMLVYGSLFLIYFMAVKPRISLPVSRQQPESE